MMKWFDCRWLIIKIEVKVDKSLNWLGNDGLDDHANNPEGIISIPNIHVDSSKGMAKSPGPEDFEFRRLFRSLHQYWNQAIKKALPNKAIHEEAFRRKSVKGSVRLKGQVPIREASHE